MANSEAKKLLDLSEIISPPADNSKKPGVVLEQFKSDIEKMIGQVESISIAKERFPDLTGVLNKDVEKYLNHKENGEIVVRWKKLDEYAGVNQYLNKIRDSVLLELIGEGILSTEMKGNYEVFKEDKRVSIGDTWKKNPEITEIKEWIQNPSLDGNTLYFTSEESTQQFRAYENNHWKAFYAMHGRQPVKDAKDRVFVRKADPERHGPNKRTIIIRPQYKENKIVSF